MSNSNPKPAVPPKPKFLGKPFMPKPPNHTIDDLNLVLRNVMIESPTEVPAELNFTNIENPVTAHFGEDGYLKPSSDIACDHSFRSKLKPKSQEGSRRLPIIGTVTGVVRAEAPELSDGSLSKRPLPLLPGEVPNIFGKPWYRPIDRRKGEELVMNGVDGCFLVRPSSKGQGCYTLTLWYQHRAYNISIRLRDDGLYSLGTPKQSEKCFVTIEEMITNYHREELILHSNGLETGRTTLTIYPS